MMPTAGVWARRGQAQAWFFGITAAAAASVGLTVVHAAPPIFLVMTGLLLASVYALSGLRESGRLAAASAGLLSVGWLMLAARPVYAPLSSSSLAWILQPFMASLLVGCAWLRALRWRRADGAAAPTPVIAAAGFATLALLVLGSHPNALGAAAAAQIELLAMGAEWLSIGRPVPAAASPGSALRWVTTPTPPPRKPAVAGA
ncbi:MAG: hypothetical protein ACREYB_11270 [Casimicrobiaceae bacterium]